MESFKEWLVKDSPFKLWLETDIKFLSFNSYGDVTVLIRDKKYTYVTRDGVIARKAFQLSKYAPWKMLNKLKKIDPNPKIT
jgi:hypothetical protein